MAVALDLPTEISEVGNVLYCYENDGVVPQMESTITRRSALSALAAGSAVAIAGCGSDETTDDSEPLASNGDDDGTDSATENGEPEVQESGNILFIVADEGYVIGAAETYEGVEIGPNGVLEFEPGGCLEFETQINA